MREFTRGELMEIFKSAKSAAIEAGRAVSDTGVSNRDEVMVYSDEAPGLPTEGFAFERLAHEAGLAARAVEIVRGGRRGWAISPQTLSRAERRTVEAKAMAEALTGSGIRAHWAPTWR